MPLSIDKSVLKISDLVNEYTKEVQEEIVERLNHTADEILAYIKTNAPKGNSTKLIHLLKPKLEQELIKLFIFHRKLKVDWFI